MILRKETKKLTRRFLTGAALALLAACMLQTTALADDFEENVPVTIDEMTGQPKESGSTDEDSDEDSGLVYIDDTCTYDFDTSAFWYSVSGIGNNLFSANVGSGAVTAGPVTINGSNGLGMVLYHDGIELSEPDFTNITDAGYYVAIVPNSNGERVQVLKFTILGAYTNTESMKVSGVYSITGASLDGSTIEVTDDSLRFTSEGTYEIQIKNLATKVTETVTTTVDRTAPTLKLAAVGENNLASGPVDISDADPNWTLTIYLNNEEITPSSTTLKDAGVYSITVTDQAGNSSNYQFTILIYLNSVGIALIIVVVVLAIGFFVYLMIMRNKQRVR